MTITNGGNNIDDGTTCGWGSASGSMSSANPLLGALAGSPAYFRSMLASPAINKGNDFNLRCFAGQQSITKRCHSSAGAHCDIGSYENLLSLSRLNSIGAQGRLDSRIR